MTENYVENACLQRRELSCCYEVTTAFSYRKEDYFRKLIRVEIKSSIHGLKIFYTKLIRIFKAMNHMSHVTN